MQFARRRLLASIAFLSLAGSISAAAAARGGLFTIADFFIPGTQPNQLVDPIKPSTVCAYCHGYFDEVNEPYRPWRASMMANAMRDPIFHACLAIANQDTAFAGDLCLRCHSPGGWLEGRSEPADGSALAGKDYEGVTCHVCHRLVDPFHDAKSDPSDDVDILNGLASAPQSIHDGSMVVDPLDRRRGPFQLVDDFKWHEYRISPFHQEALLCSTCHDVSNPAYLRQGGATPSVNDTYQLAADGAQHPTQNKYDMFPIERTYSEWSASSFAKSPIEMNGRFGGNKSAVSTCQDCHMPDSSGEACAPGFEAIYRDDLPVHDFRGANTWVLRAVLALDQSQELYGFDEASFLQPEEVDAAVARNEDFLRRASDMELSVVEGKLNVRIINQCGHKLPTGYTEGRRMWINVQYFNASGQMIAEHGYYNLARGNLYYADTKVYEAQLGVDQAVSAITGIPPRPGFHFALNNVVYKDNRIPPRGYTAAGFEAVQAAPVGASFAEGQYWDDTQYDIPAGAISADARLYYQTTSREYVEFLRSANTTNNRGEIAYKLWDKFGRSAPVEMDHRHIDFSGGR